MRLYLDVDGTLLRRGGHARLRGDLAPALNLRPFLQWATDRYDCAWLTSRNRDGNDDAIRTIFRHAIGPGDEADAVDSLLARIRPTRWDEYKAQAIDFTTPFLWLDDAPEEESLARLTQHGTMASWVPIAVDQQPDDLRRVMKVLGKRG
ncbi:MAG: hypothetical protein H7Z12_05000 [Rhodospirillaceae bacterium]|nr:hypothetical protein [Rhodospirillales bacterium]